jgi:hypothetical protein
MIETSGSLALGPRVFFHTPLESLFIGPGVHEIGEKCFSECHGGSKSVTQRSTLKYIQFNQNSSIRFLGREAFARTPLADLMAFGCLSESAFAETSLHSVRLLDFVEVIPSSCFSCCAALTTFTFSSDSRLQVIEAHAFHGSHLTQTNFPTSLREIHESAFEGCLSLVSVTFQSSSSSSPFGHLGNHTF